jgi:Prp8 binding protein
MTEPEIVVSGGDDCHIIIHDCRQREIVAKLRSNSPVTSISVSQSFIAVGGVCGSVFVDSFDLKMIYRMDCTDTIFGVAIDKNERFLAANDASGKLTFFDLQSFTSSNDRKLCEVQNGIPRQEVVPCRVSISTDRRFVACGSTDEVLRIWDIENLRKPLLAKEIKCHKGSVTGVDFHPKYQVLASGGMDGIVIVRDIGDFADDGVS